ncbi:MAG: 2-hydroxyacyl-CoA dehydratase [Bacilli bacterium]|nr:2-hydroxyacyl-CoA dehydratase [Bacilli bacterium]
MTKFRKAFFKTLRDEKYTILIPNMLPIHIRLLAMNFQKFGYNAKMMEVGGRKVKDQGLKYVHNDACYPALLVVGQCIEELKSGNYDLNKVACFMTQTGGGCRASNYLSLIRKAIQKEYPQIPVVSLNFSGLEKDYSIPTPPKMIFQGLTCVLYGDMMMNLYNQTKPYETYKGEADEILDDCFKYISNKLDKGGFFKTKKNYTYMIDKFNKIKIPEKRKPRVGIVGEIYVKYSSLANNDLVDFLVKEGCEAYSPALSEFISYCIINIAYSHKDYGTSYLESKIAYIIYKIFNRMALKQGKMLKGTQYIPYEDFEDIRACTSEIISPSVKMGEGWLIPSEMLEMYRHGIKNIVCCQPFGCLPNHIVGKGMVRPLKKLCPDLNIAPIDYDPGATKVNQENRIKLMLANIGREAK